MRKNGDCSGLKKSEAKFKWKSRGLKPEHFELELYNTID